VGNELAQRIIPDFEDPSAELHHDTSTNTLIAGDRLHARRITS
jgi:hypothetical protein